MINTTSIDSFEALVAQLEKEEIPYRRMNNENTVAVPTRLGDEQSMLQIRWAATPGVIQFMQVLPFVAPESRRDDIALLIGRINMTLPILGFTLNPKTGVIAFRTHAFLGKEGAIAPGLIGAVIAGAVRTTKSFLPQLREASSVEEINSNTPITRVQ